MSNGTRIDPEEREPRAIKIRQPKRKGKKIAIILAAVVLVAAGVFAFIKFGPEISLPKIQLPAFDFEFKKDKAEEDIIETEEPEITEEPVEEEPIEETPVTEEPIIEEPEIPEELEPIVEEDPIPRDEWYMILVNRENPLPEGYTFTVKAIDEYGHSLDERIYNDFAEMISAGTDEGLDFVFYTGYRTLERQKELFENGKTDAAPGTSEHNTGLAIDIGTPYEGAYEDSAEAKWLAENAYKYGFILRYPEGKDDITGFEHEPWHFRYVGKEQAKLIFESGLCLEEYLAQ